MLPVPGMSTTPTVPDTLAAYLNDHLAASVAALNLLARLEVAEAGAPAGVAIAGLRAEVEAERDVLQGLLDRLGVRESGARQAAAWLAGKVGEGVLLAAKPRPEAPAFHRFEGLETILLGLRGKLALWEMLAALDGPPALLAAGVDFPALARRAADQHARAEALRLAAGRACLRG